MRGRPVGTSSVLAGAMAVGALAACTASPPTPSDGSALVTSTTSPSVPATASPSSGSATSPTAPANEIPEAARVNTPEGAEAFTKYFGEVLNKAFVDQREVSLEPLVLAECKSCSGISGSIVNYRQKGERFVGQYVHVTNAVFSSDLNGVTKILAATDQAGGRVVDSKGALVETAPPSKGNLAVQLRFDGQWRVLEMQGVA